jgi:hypothetical protein
MGEEMKMRLALAQGLSINPLVSPRRYLGGNPNRKDIL